MNNHFLVDMYDAVLECGSDADWNGKVTGDRHFTVKIEIEPEYQANLELVLNIKTVNCLDELNGSIFRILTIMERGL